MPYKSDFPEIIAAIPVRLNAGLRAGAERVETAAKSRVTVSSGGLRNAIHVEDIEDGYAVIAGDDDVFYGHLVEHGTSHTAPRPFLVPALEESAEEIAGFVAAALKGLE